VSGIPARLLRDSISVQAYQGESGVGPIYAAAATVYGRVQMTRELVRDAAGVEVVSEMTLYVSPDDAAKFAPESSVTAGGRTSTVIGVSTHSRPGEAVVTKVVCR